MDSNRNFLAAGLILCVLMLGGLMLMIDDIGDAVDQHKLLGQSISQTILVNGEPKVIKTERKERELEDSWLDRHERAVQKARKPEGGER